MRERCIRLLLACGPHQRCDRIQRIEEKMRLKLHLQRLKFGSRKLLSEFEGAKRFALCCNMHPDDGAGRPDQRVNQKLETESSGFEKVDRKQTGQGATF